MSTSTEYGLFTAEGLLEGDFWSEADALRAKSYHHDEESAEEISVDLVCPSCRGGIAGYCDACDEEEDQ